MRTHLCFSLALIAFGNVAFAQGPASTLTLERRWRARTPGGGGSSPRVVDLEGDGVFEVIVGGGHMGQGGAAAVIDAKSGKIRWRRHFKDENYATPLLLDVNGDGVKDVLTGGRVRNFFALDGRSGKTLWSIRGKNKNIARLNFNGAVALSDQDADGVGDLLVSQGGSYDDGKRLLGRTLVVSGKTGRLLGTHRSADKRETYAFPALAEGGRAVVLATGGWTLGGHLFWLSFPGFEEAWRRPSVGRGFVASPILVDFGGEGGPDVVAVDFDANVIRVDGRSGALRWTVSSEGYETTATPAVGAFGGDATLDVVVAISRGKLPVYDDHARLLWIDGATGAVLDRRKVGAYIQASPVTADLDGDGLDETVVIANMGPNPQQFGAVLAVFSGKPGHTMLLQTKLDRFSACTPWLGDLDGNGKLDLLLAHFTHVERWEFSRPGKVRWGQFRGPAFTGAMPAPGRRALEKPE